MLQIDKANYLVLGEGMRGYDFSPLPSLSLAAKAVGMVNCIPATSQVSKPLHNDIIIVGGYEVSDSAMLTCSGEGGAEQHDCRGSDLNSNFFMEGAIVKGS